MNIPAGKAAMAQLVHPNSDFAGSGKRFHANKQAVAPVRKVKATWLKPTNAERTRPAEPPDRGLNPMDSEIARLMGAMIATRPVMLGSIGLSTRPDKPSRKV